ncbi:MAG: hypothetical protein ABI411_14440 [Tahibacter sp.]
MKSTAAPTGHHCHRTLLALLIIGVYSLLGIFVEKFCDFSIYMHQRHWDHPITLAAVASAFLVPLTFFLWRYRKELSSVFFLLFGASMLECVALTSRNWLSTKFPRADGSLHFFLFFALLSWCILQLAELNNRFPYIVACAALTLAFRNTPYVGQRRHVQIDWLDQISQCTHTESDQKVAIYCNGEADWRPELPAADCRLISDSCFARTTICEISRR